MEIFKNPFDLITIRKCPYCKGILRARRGGMNRDHTIIQYVSSCEKCGWWYLSAWMEAEYEREHAIYEGILKTYDISETKVPIDVLRGYLENHLDAIRFVNPGVFERLVADVYADFYPGSKVKHIGGPGDNGIDLFAVINDEPHAIQVKRRANLALAESPSVVRELIGAMLLRGLRKGHLVTTSTKFSKAALAYQGNEHLRRSKIEIQLKNLASIYDMLRVSNVNLGKIWDSIVPWSDWRH